jgi:hypothetical protein
MRSVGSARGQEDRAGVVWGMLRRMGKGLVGALVLAAIAFPASAGAGTYTVVACQWAGAGGQNNSWQSEVLGFGVAPQPTAYQVVSQCQPGGAGLQVQSGGDANAGFFTFADWVFQAPAGTRITRLQISRHGEKRRFSDDPDSGDGWKLYGQTADGSTIGGAIGGETCANPVGQPVCSVPAAGAPDPQTFDLSTTRIGYGIICASAKGQTVMSCPTNFSGFPLAFMGVRGAAVTLTDESAPTLTAAGPLLADGWVPGSATVTANASDNVGIASLKVLVDGATRDGGDRSCDFTRAVPCSNAPDVALGLGTAELTDGTHTVAVTATDAAGNPATTQRSVRIDFHAPTVIAALPRRGLVRASIVDGASGVKQVVVTARDDRGGAAHALRLARLRRGRTSARYGRIPASHLVLHVTASDAAGNTRVDDGRPTALSVTRARVGTRTRRVRGARITVPYGRSVTVHGRLVDAAGRGQGGRALTAAATISRAGAKRSQAGTATTDAKGRFAIGVPAGVSRTIRLAFDGGGGALRTARGVSLRVPAHSTIHASRTRLRGAGRVAFRGTVARRGQSIPRGGLTVLLQGRQGGTWQDFRATRTDRQGHWATTYRFTGRAGSFPIRALVRRSPSFPFAAGTSRVLRVRVQ